MKRSKFWRFAAAVTTTSVSIPASAGIYVSGQYEDGTGIHPVSSPGSYGGGDISVALSPIATVKSYADSSSYEGFSEATLGYDYQVVGSSNTMVPVSITYTLGSSADGVGAIGLSAISTSLYDISGNLLPSGSHYSIACSTTSPTSCSSYDGWTGMSDISGGIFAGYVPSNTSESIELETYAFASHLLCCGSASGWADPHITILDPNFTLQLDPGVGNATGLRGAVPEPATWAMMLLGFGAIGFGMRRKLKNAHAQQLA